MGETLHAAPFPAAARQFPGALRVSKQRAQTGKSDLAAMGMAAKIKRDPRLGSFAKELGRVHGEDFELLLGNALQGAFQIIATIVVRIVQTDKPHPVLSPLQGDGLVDQHGYPQLFQELRGFEKIVVSQKADDSRGGPDRSERLSKGVVHGQAGTVDLEPEISGHEAKVVRQISDLSADPLRKAWDSVDVEVGEMEDSESIELRRQMGEEEGLLPNLEIQRVLLTLMEETDGFQERGDDAAQKSEILEMKGALAVREPCLEVPDLDGSSLLPQVRAPSWIRRLSLKAF